MPREHKTKYAILGLLAREPMTGYEIKKKIEGSLSNFWSESYGQIYPAIKVLEQEGYITRTQEKTEEGKPDRFICAITDAGRNVLREWLVEPAEPHRERVEVLLKFFFGRNMPVEDSIRHIQRFRDEHMTHAVHYTEGEKMLTERLGNDPEAPYWIATIRCGIAASRAMVEWCDETLNMLEKIKEGEPWQDKPETG